MNSPATVVEVSRHTDAGVVPVKSLSVTLLPMTVLPLRSLRVTASASRVQSLRVSGVALEDAISIEGEFLNSARTIAGVNVVASGLQRHRGFQLHLSQLVRYDEQPLDDAGVTTGDLPAGITTCIHQQGVGIFVGAGAARVGLEGLASLPTHPWLKLRNQSWFDTTLGAVH